jgi:hypothetical protein
MTRPEIVLCIRCDALGCSTYTEFDRRMLSDALDAWLEKNGWKKEGRCVFCPVHNNVGDRQKGVK